ncbi:MAG: FAD-dependent oxidoreductase [Candidatus Saganbacteria bacterium]|nr:FAD-dependent oxidoreductase [Candidatus Saganbacteria bacterium]
MKYDIIVIGSGPGGTAAALEAASLDKKVALIEKSDLGGVCLNKGCIPTKSIIASCALYLKMKKAGEFGLSAENISFDWKKIQERKNNVVSRLRKALALSFKNAGIEIINGKASVKGAGSVSVENEGKEQALNCSKVIIATGTEKAAAEGFLTSDEVLDMETLPERIAIIGAGAVGVEFACIFNVLGSEVSLYEMLPKILPSEDEEISSLLESILRKKGIKIETGRKADINALEVSGIPVMIASGRKYEKIDVNEKMETATPGIYAIGDVTGISMYAHTATMQGIVAARNACEKDAVMDYSAVPSCTFSFPEVASCGLTEKEAKEKGMDIKTSKFNFAALGKSTVSGEREGFVKLVANAKTGVLLGGHIIGDNASDLIAEITLAIRNKLTAQDISKTIHSHPTLPEAVWEAGRLFKAL